MHKFASLQLQFENRSICSNGTDDKNLLAKTSIFAISSNKRIKNALQY